MSLKSFIEKYFIFFLYTSLFFLVVFLVRYDYFSLNLNRIRYQPLILSFLFLFLGCLTNAYSWYAMCRLITDKVSLADGITSHGLSIFGKYIPGKIWTVVGRATYISRKGMTLKTATQLSFYTLILSIWSGLTLGMFLLFQPHLTTYYTLIVGISWAIFSVVLFLPIHFPLIQERFSFYSFQGDQGSTHRFTGKQWIKVLPCFFICWFFWTLAFYFLLNSVLPYVAYRWYTALTFPFAATISILAIVFPGGLGIRESLLVFFLMECSLSLEHATLVSITSRIWFTIGEVFIFLVALWIKFLVYRKQMKNTSPFP